MLYPTHDRYVGASSVQFADYRRQRGDQVGLHWRIPASTGRRAVRYVLYDTNWWKSFVADRLRAPVGDRASLSLWSAPREQHQMLAEHVTAEQRVPVEARGRRVDEWRLKQPNLDNHLFDCLVGSAVAASMSGVQLAVGDGAAPVRRRIRLSELQARKRAMAG
ncbi:MAG: terminase gpA endonuclease subunit [Phycisphaerales bacterium]